MKLINECFKIVKKSCYKFIKSQETSKDKFKNKDTMIKAFLIPICFWISIKTKIKKPFIVGLAGGQGTGKTTISSILEIILKKYFKLNVFRISIDDFYKTRRERNLLSKKVHPLLMTRGVPGTHDVNLISGFFKKSKSKNFKSFKVPKFDKSIDDRCKSKQWYSVKKKPDVIIFEGWCVGARHEYTRTLRNNINTLEKYRDSNLKWRKYVNVQLKTKYKLLFRQLNCLLYLKASSFKMLQKWRLVQERKLKLQSKNKKNSSKIMNKQDVLQFMQTYQRITQNMFKKAPKYASIILNLNNNHQIKSAIYKTK